MLVGMHGEMSGLMICGTVHEIAVISEDEIYVQVFSYLIEVFSLTL